MELMKAIKERRSINFFEPGVELPDGKIKELLEIANLSPSSFNMQPWDVVVVKDPGKKKVLRKCAFDQPKVEESSAVLIMVANPRFLENNMEKVLKSWLDLGYIQQDQIDTYRGMARNLYGAPDSTQRIYAAIKNTSIYAATLMLAAKGLGLETHPMDGFDEGCIKKEFNIPDDKVIPMIIAVGHIKKDFTLLPRAFRRPLEDFVSYDSYVEKEG